MFYLRVPASLGQLVFVSRKLMHSADIVYKKRPYHCNRNYSRHEKRNNCHYLSPQTTVEKKKKNLQTRTNVIEALASEKNTTVLKGDELGDEPRM